jgi:hypothetical protein
MRIFYRPFNTLRIFLERIDKANFRINIEKCAFITQEFEYLGYLVTTTGICPLPSKVETMLQLKSSKALKVIALILGRGKLLP